MKKTRKDLIKDLIDEYTAFYIREGSFTFELCNAEDISLTLEIDRSNVSRLLNQMFNQFELIKVKGRPTIFLSKEVLQNQYNYTNIPQVIDSQENLHELFVKNTTKKSINVKSEFDMIGNTPEGSLYTIVNMIVPAVLFTQPTIGVIALAGKQGSGRKLFCRKLFEYAQKNKRFPKSSQLLYLSYMEIIEKRTTIFQNIDLEQIGMIVVQVDKNIAPDSIHQFLNSTSHSYLNMKIQPPVIVFVMDERITENTRFFKQITPYYAKYPGLHDRPVKELVEIIVKEIQKQADHLSVRIKITNDTVMTLIITEYAFGIQQMMNELRAVIARASYLNRHMNAKVIYISNDLLNSEIFVNVREDTYHQEQARQIALVLLPEIIDFVPNTQSEAEKMLQTIYQGDRVFIDVSKRTIMQQARFEVLNMNTNILVQIAPANQRLSFLMTHLFSKTSIRDDIPLLDFLYTQITRMIEGTYIINYSHDDVMFKEDEQSRNISNAIIDMIENKYDVVMKNIYKCYIRNYIYYALALTPTKKIGALILSNQFGLGENYAQHINHFLNMRICYTFCYNELTTQYTKHEFTKSLSLAVNRTDRGKGVVLITDQKLPNREETEIISNTNIPVVSLYKTNQYLLQEATKHLDIPSVNLTVLLYNAIRTKKAIKQYYAETTLTAKQERTLNDLLIANSVETFIHVNLIRSSEILYSIVKEICYRLHIEVTNGVIIEMIFHLNFMLERYAAKMNYHYEHIEEFKKQHDLIYHTVRKVIQSQKELLGYVFHESEYIVITGLILQFKNNGDTIEFSR